MKYPTSRQRDGGRVDICRKAPGGILLTIVLGIVGAVVGAFIGTQLGFGDVSGFDIRSMALAVGGGIVVLLVYGLLTKGRA